MPEQEPRSDMLGDHPGSDHHSDQHALEEHQHPDDAGKHAAVPEDFDVEDPTEAGDGEPVHHNAGAELGDGAD